MSTVCYCSPCNPMVAARSDEKMLDMADDVAREAADRFASSVVAESSRRLFIACAAFLRDWFPDADLSICGMERLLSLALMQGKYDTNVNFRFRKTPFDILFEELETGKACRVDGRGDITTEKSTFCRKGDHVRPGDIGGMKPGTDIAVSFYHSWLQSGSPPELEKSIYACIEGVAALGSRD